MYYLRASTAVVEKESQINDWKIIFHGESLDDVEGFLLITFEQKPKEGEVDPNSMWNWKHVEILCDDLVQHRYYFQHKWLPENAWFRLNPVYEKIAQYVKPQPTPKKVADLAAYKAEFEKMALGASAAAE